MIQQKNYAIMTLALSAVNHSYNRIALQRPDKFMVSPSIKDELGDVHKVVFISEIRTMAKNLGITLDASNLNLRYEPFKVSDEELQHHVLSMGRTRLISDLHITLGDDQAITEMIGNLIESMAGLIDHVNPDTLSIINNVKQELQSRDTEILRNGYKVVEVGVPQYLQVLTDEGLLEPTEQLLTVRNINTVDFSEHTTYLPTDNTTASLAMREYLSNFSDEKINEVFETHVKGIDMSSDEWATLMKRTRSPEEEAIFNISFILFIGMVHERGFRNISIDDHMLEINNILNYYKININTTLSVFNNELKNEIVVKNIVDKTIYVNGYTLQVGYKRGLTIDTLYGLAVSRDKSMYSTTIPKLLVNQEAFENNWTSHVKGRRALIDIKNTEHTKRLVAKCIKDRIESDSYYDIEGDIITKVVDKLDKDDEYDLERTIQDIMIALSRDPYIRSFKDIVDKERKNDIGEKGDINTYAGVALYRVISRNILGRLRV